MVKIVNLIDLHIVLTYDCWHYFLVFNISVNRALEMTIHFYYPTLNPWVVLFFIYPTFYLLKILFTQPFSLRRHGRKSGSNGTEVQAHAFIILCHQYPTPSPLMFVVCYSQGFNIFFSPLWEMVQDGIDLKSIKWTQHWNVVWCRKTIRVDYTLVCTVYGVIQCSIDCNLNGLVPAYRYIVTTTQKNYGLIGTQPY
jgi:hypothetical protein